METIAFRLLLFRFMVITTKTRMGNIQNIVGVSGEFFVATEILRPVTLATQAKGFLFEPVLFGGKEPTLDYIIYLLDMNAQRFGPFFFLQVKTTRTGPNLAGSYNVQFPRDAVSRAKNMKIPFFVCVVDVSDAGNERIYIRGVEASRMRGISTIDTRFDLRSDSIKIELFKEVTRIWSQQTSPALTALI